MDLKFDPKKYWDERLSEHYDLIGVGDISLTINYNQWSYKVTKYRLRKIFRKIISNPEAKILDIGSGTGFVIDIWAKQTNKINGIDISSTAISRLKQKYPTFNFFELDAGTNSIPLDDNSLDAVSASSVLYHLVEDSSLSFLLQNVHRVLKNGSYFIFSDNFIHGSFFNIEHQKCRTLESYQKLLRENGFEIVDRIPNYVLFNDPVDAKGKFYPRIWYWLTFLSKKSKLFDALIWPLLYPVEIFLTSVKKESPAQEIMICRVKK